MGLEERWHEEKQSAWLYHVVAAADGNAQHAKLFLDLALSAERQAAILAAAIREAGAQPPELFEPSRRARTVALLTRLLGPKRVRPVLAAMKVRGLSIYRGSAPQAGHPMPASVDDIGHRHRQGAGAVNLRAAVFGANDGLVSNMSLIMGVAGATSEATIVVLSGAAGLLAGAFSMAAGEYLSVRSQRELYEYQIKQERAELEHYPDEEAEELALIYHARGVSMEQARSMSSLIFEDKERALRTLAVEELGVNPDELGSPWGAAAASFVTFSLGAVVPLLPFTLDVGPYRLEAAFAVSAVALFGIGALISLFSGKQALRGGLRMLVIGSAAALATYLIGSLLGVGLAAG